MKYETKVSWDFLGGPVVKTLPFHCMDHGSGPWWRNSDAMNMPRGGAKNTLKINKFLTQCV